MRDLIEDIDASDRADKGKIFITLNSASDASIIVTSCLNPDQAFRAIELVC